MENDEQWTEYTYVRNHLIFTIHSTTLCIIITKNVSIYMSVYMYVYNEDAMYALVYIHCTFCFVEAIMAAMTPKWCGGFIS